MNTPRNPEYRRKPILEEMPVTSFTRVIGVAPNPAGFDGWGPSRWN